MPHDAISTLVLGLLVDHQGLDAVVTLLVWLVASQVRLSYTYVAVAAALLLFLAGSALLGAALGIRASLPLAMALMLTTSMRDFAIAAGIAVAAFGAASAAPLGALWRDGHRLGHGHRDPSVDPYCWLTVRAHRLHT